MQNLLQDRVCLVTGATRGIGKAIALALANQGGIVWGTATSEVGAQTIQNSFQEHAVTGHGCVLNVQDDVGIEALITKINEETGPPTVLVNNAGITCDNLLMRMKDDEWQRVIDTNLRSVYKLSKSCLRGMTKARQGRIVNIASVVGVSGNAGQTNYAAAKAGIIGFSKSLAQEIASRGITVNTIAPGFIDTDMTSALTEDQKRLMRNKIPMNSFGAVEDIANAVVFLSSDMAGYITGNTLHVNGGMFMV